MADPSVRREVLRQQAFRAILEAVRALPQYKHTAFMSGVVCALIEDGNEENLRLVVDTIDRTRLWFKARAS